MSNGIISLQDSFNETLPAVLIIITNKFVEMFNLASRRNFKAICITFPDLGLTFVEDMFDGIIAVLLEFHNFHLLLMEQKLDCDQMF